MTVNANSIDDCDLQEYFATTIKQRYDILLTFRFLSGNIFFQLNQSSIGIHYYQAQS
ncbi:hypothetical protein Mal35_18800 [Gimesia maris]|nr:hypothetical protein Mal35_18800 [Gimesia maris]